PRQPVAIAAHRPRQHLDRDLATELRVARAVDLAHAARAEMTDDILRADASADRQLARRDAQHACRYGAHRLRQEVFGGWLMREQRRDFAPQIIVAAAG